MLQLARVLIAATALFAGCHVQASTWVWAWDRTEDLRWLPPEVGVAWFAAHIDVRKDAVTVVGRRAVLRVRPGARLLPVVHIEAFDPRYPAVLDGPAIARWADTLAEVIRRFNVRRVQLDFEARAGQRDFYRRVLIALRARLSSDITLSMTALASWCGDPAWLASLPVDEIVPMYFRMGPTERRLWRRRMAAPETLPSVCRHAAGISIDEWSAMKDDAGPRFHEALTGRPLYMFAPRPWRPAMLHDLPLIHEAPDALAFLHATLP